MGIILKRILNKYAMRMQTALIWLRTETRGSCEHKSSTHGSRFLPVELADNQSGEENAQLSYEICFRIYDICKKSVDHCPTAVSHPSLLHVTVRSYVVLTLTWRSTGLQYRFVFGTSRV
jgi:hypothetical protein